MVEAKQCSADCGASRRLRDNVMGPRWIWCFFFFIFCKAIVKNLMCSKSLACLEADFAVLPQEHCCEGKQCTWVALGSITTLIGFGEVIFSEGTPFWQSDSQKHESLKCYPVILDHYQSLPLYAFAVVGALSQELRRRVTRQNVHSTNRTVTINGPIHSSL